MQRNIENPWWPQEAQPSTMGLLFLRGCRHPIITKMKHTNRKLCLRRFRLLDKGNIFQNGRLSLSHAGIGSISDSVFSIFVNCNAYLKPRVGVQTLKLLLNETHQISPTQACHKISISESVVTELAETMKVQNFRWYNVAITWFLNLKRLQWAAVTYRRVWFVITLACAIYHNLFNANTY